MADFDNGDIVRLGASFLMRTTDVIVNVFNVIIDSGAPMAFAAAAQDFQQYIHFMYDPLMTWYSNQFTSDRISVKNETQATVWGSIAFQAPLVGTNLGDETSQQVALLGWGRTSLSRVQIRKYWGPFTESSLTAGLWLSAIRADILGRMDYHILPQVLGNGLQLTGVAYSTTLLRATVALSATTAEVPVVQRRRRRGTGA